MLKAPEHQVAGHSAAAGGLGPLTDGLGLFYKPLQSHSRGDAELAFYTAFSSSSPSIPAAVRRFFPAFHGTKLLPASDGSGPTPHLVLADLLADLPRPSVLDLKIGAITWPPNSPDSYVQKCISKDRDSTSITLGFRVSGLQILDADSSFHRPDRDLVRRYTADDVRRVLRRFVGHGRLTCAVYGGADGALAQLRELKAWFEEQTLFHFYSASVLLAYGEGEVRVRLVDFAHWVEGDRVIDHNFLGGLCSLIKFVKEVVDEAEEHANGVLKLERLH